MKIFGQIKLNSEPYEHSTSLFSRSLVEWAAERFSVQSEGGAAIIYVESGQEGVNELIDRMRSESDHIPSAFWSIKYSAQDINSASLLHLWSTAYIAELMRSPVTEKLTVIASGKGNLKSPRSLGQIYAFSSAIAVNEKMREKIKGSDFIGAGFSEIEINKRCPEHKTIWKLDPALILPVSPIPLKKPFGEPFDGDFSTGCHYRQCYRDGELSYFQDDIASMGIFDMAATRELVGNYPNGMFRHIVVSQRFRQFLKEQRVPGVHYTPVRIIKPNDSPVRNPFDELLTSHHSQQHAT